MAATNERIIFRLIHTPCCHTMLCWVNPRLPNVCPECGERIYAKLKTGDHIITSSEGWLRVKDYDAKGTWAEYNELRDAAERMEKAITALTTEIRAYSSPECDDEGNIGAAELKECDEAVVAFKATGGNNEH